MDAETEAEMIIRSAQKVATAKVQEIERALLVQRNNIEESIAEMRRRDSESRKMHLDFMAHLKSETEAAKTERDAVVGELTALRVEVAQLQAKRDEIRARILSAVAQC